MNYPTIIFDTKTVALAVVLAGSTYLLYRRHRRSNKQQRAPSPPGNWLLGHALHMAGPQADTFYERLSADYGSIVSLFIFNRRIVTLADYESIKAALIDQSEAFVDRPRNRVIDKITLDGHGVIFSNGAFWQEQRRFALSSMRQLGMGRSRVDAMLVDEAEALIGAFEREPTQDPGLLLTRATANGICSLVFGRRYEYDDEKFTKLFMLFASIAKPEPERELMILFVFPQLAYIPFSPFRRAWFKMLSDFQTMRDAIEEIIADHEGGSKDSTDLIDAFLDARQSAPPAVRHHYSDEQLFVLVKDLFIAGLDTTANTLYWALFLMAHNPQVQALIHEEMDRELGSSRPVTVQHRARLPYTHAALLEVMRFRTLTPTSVARMANRDVVVGDVRIRKGEEVWPLLWAVHRDARFWRNPSEYDPRNFLDDDGARLNVPKQFMSFSVGKRVCLGESLARNETFVYFANLMQRFRFDKAAGDDDPLFPDADAMHKGALMWVCRKYRVTAVAR